ncbi:ATP:glycerol 3-phosphotransferase 5 [Intoshia linei]|uniref:ATP:glycerol 3-phosphotransferase 5 n=1 Tax=Intoshia linei TaxID=1819745 RepID=A0A177B9J7_9BILA|nr:ATP:glycerol 3-phosphotransferase 5 [Intoshia linei]
MSKFIISVDIGSTNIKAILINHENKLVKQLITPLIYHKSVEGVFEIEPVQLYNDVLNVIKSVIKNQDKSYMYGICFSCQRSSLIAWNSETGKNVCNIISWRDTRNTSIVKYYNERLLSRLLKWTSSILSKFIKSEYLKTLKNFSYAINQAPMKIVWVLYTFPEARKLEKQNKLRVGTLDTWILNKLTKNKIFVTDYSSASNGLLDPFTLKWNKWLCKSLGFSTELLPKLVETDWDFGHTDSEIFGYPIKILASIGDQQASLFGNYCYEPEDVKISLGTSASINITKKSVLGVANDFYPTIAWKLTSGDIAYSQENLVKNFGRILEDSANVNTTVENCAFNLFRKFENAIDNGIIHAKTKTLM